MSRLLTASLALTLALSAAGIAPARADSDEAFFRRVTGQWSGPGEIVAGKYKGTKFVCTFSGNQNEKAVGVELDGSCRVGLFSQPMHAEVVRSGRSYRGAFQDGAKGKGLDIVSGQVMDDHIVVGLDRKKLKGAMIARLEDDDALSITVSVKVASQLVPVIGMNLKRQGGMRQSALSE
ncbi:hypothetical protein LQ948_08490 [Jiella sp. MQZ9-1]|uniref:Uncharacterized protein n=1 Tax=Jiella flava TaxID=2816857 RepID=A0A939FZC9_9HYPH|nr:hypothetical protein [Jiella flava]MBO0662995.1 hypothetical protein [Jiella flava]MCD2471246.1 hypothetical protein [Jiella flava]